MYNTEFGTLKGKKMISTKEAADKLGVNARRIRVLCEQERIKGAEKISGVWLLPNNPIVKAAPRRCPGKIKMVG